MDKPQCCQPLRCARIVNIESGRVTQCRNGPLAIAASCAKVGKREPCIEVPPIRGGERLDHLAGRCEIASLAVAMDDLEHSAP
jgi:hypothetical protein